MDTSYTNALIDSASPYLLQHAHNPVNWVPWSNEAIEEAKRKNKLILVSIGYAACHWCHVMAHESFEDEQVAKVMNDHFICIKIDREERPDVDHYYMTAVQLMGQQGGWPLNVIAMPDGKPVWGGTYFPRELWMKNIAAVAAFYREKPEETGQYANDLQNGISRASLTVSTEHTALDDINLAEVVNKWKKNLDFEKGGRLGQPKFPMPVNLEFLLYYGTMKKDDSILKYVETTLLKMARGGIYDQVGGGFARYSVDDIWKVPHFEKMLYDNGQLISIYSKGYQVFKNQELKTVVYDTIHFIERELTDESGAFYSSLDADSEGEEGKFYVWKKEELKLILMDDFDLFSRYYNVNDEGYWENGNYILLRSKSDEAYSRELNMPEEALRERAEDWKKMILKARAERIRPGLDDKTLFSWNALIINGLCDAYKVFGEPDFLSLAEKNAAFLVHNMITEDGGIFHTWKKGKSSIPGFMEDYALGIQAFTSLFEITGKTQWLNYATGWLDYSVARFLDKETGQFYYSEMKASEIITNYYQNEDNVIPAANSVMAINLHKMYLLLGNTEYRDYANRMLRQTVTSFLKYPMAFANWGNLVLRLTEPYFEAAVTGPEANQYALKLQSEYRPNVLTVFSREESEVPLLKDRFSNKKTLIYVCREGSCNMPVDDVEKAVGLLMKDA